MAVARQEVELRSKPQVKWKVFVALLAAMGGAAAAGEFASGGELAPAILTALRGLGQSGEVDSSVNASYDVRYAGYWAHQGPPNACMKGTTHPGLAGENVVHREYPVDPENCVGLDAGPEQNCFFVEEGVVDGQTVADFCVENEDWKPTDLPAAGTLFQDVDRPPILP